MIRSSDYIDRDLAGRPYDGTDEYLADCFSFLDMFIEESRQVTDRATSKDYYSLPPCMRRSGGMSETLGDEAARMSAHILGRQIDVEMPFTQLSRILELSLYEKLAVLAALSVEYDERYSGIYSEILGHRCDYPTVGLVNTLYRLIGGESGREQTALTDINGRMTALFFDMSGEEDSPAPARRLRLYDDMTAFLLGNESLEDYIESVTRDKTLTRGEDVIIGADVLSKTVDLLQKIRNESDERGPILLSGQGASAKQAVVRLFASQEGQDALVINMDFMEGLPTGERQKYLHRIRFAALGTDVILVSGLGCDKALQPQVGVFVSRLCADMPTSTVFVDLGDDDDSVLNRLNESPVFAGARVVEIEAPDLDGRFTMWMETLIGCDMADDVDFMELAEGYELSYDDIVRISTRIVKKSELMGEQIDRKMIRDAINDSCSASFGTLAQRLRTDFTWDDICIEPSQKKILMMACDRYMHRNRVCRDLEIGGKGAYGNGVSVLLYGPPGTGKTMAAQIVANEVGLPLFRVDLSQLSSKYIGETQKNLSKVFDEAARTNVILFFDEADSVFAKRTEVETSNDRHSNSESAFLLQKLESYSGFVLLATNLFNNFDNAFVRRITYACSLISPNEKTRIEIFKTALPKKAVTDGKLDFEFFGSRFELSGSNIKSIVTSAVYMASIEGVPVSNRHITLSLFYEYKKLGKMLPVSDLGPYGIYLKETI